MPEDGSTYPLRNSPYSSTCCGTRRLVLTRTMITENVWDYDVFHQSNAVDVYIRNLRRKIDDDFEPKLIQTVRGVGYRLSPGPEA